MSMVTSARFCGSPRSALVRVVGLAWGLLVALAAPGAETEMLANGGMEAPFVNGIARSWSPNCYGSNEVVFTEESVDVHSGRSAQRVTCRQFASGGVQFHSGDIAIQKGQPYTLRLWLKGDVAVPIYVGIRKHGAPYTSYLRRDVRVKKDWTPCLILGEPSESDARCAIYIMFAGTGALLVDDVSLQPGVHEESAVELAGPAQKGNRIYNSGFEAGAEGWTPVNGFALDEQAAHSGRFSARIEPAPARGEAGGLECRPFPVRTGRRYTLSAWIKAATPNAGVRLRLFEWADRGGDWPENRHERQTTITATTEWARYQLSGVLLPNLHEGYVARIVPSSRIWLDDVQVEEGSETDYQPAQPIEVGAETPTRWCRVGEVVEVTARVAAGPQIEAAALNYTLEDLWSRPLTNLTHQVKPGQPDRAPFRLDQAGLYRVRVRAKESPATGEVWFGVFPERDRQPQQDSPFGTHVTSMVPDPRNAMLASEAMGARWVRLHDFGDFCHWWRVEPEKGRFVWHDPEINALRDRGFLILANLGHPPLWAGRELAERRSSGGWTPAPPRDPAEWEDYVFRTVEHYRDRIHHWEVWNEPYWTGFFAGTPEEYAGLLKVAYRAIKRADPQAAVVGGCFSPGDENWTGRVLAAGGFDCMDALSYHVYWSPPQTQAAADAVPVVARQVERFRELMRPYGQPKPIFMSEGGIRCPPFASWLLADGFERSAPFHHAGTETGPTAGMVALKVRGAGEPTLASPGPLSSVPSSATRVRGRRASCTCA